MRSQDRLKRRMSWVSRTAAALLLGTGVGVGIAADEESRLEAVRTWPREALVTYTEETAMVGWEAYVGGAVAMLLMTGAVELLAWLLRSLARRLRLA